MANNYLAEFCMEKGLRQDRQSGTLFGVCGGYHIAVGMENVQMLHRWCEMSYVFFVCAKIRRVCYFATLFTGLPLMKACRLDARVAIRRVRAAWLAHAM